MRARHRGGVFSALPRRPVTQFRVLRPAAGQDELKLTQRHEWWVAGSQQVPAKRCKLPTGRAPEVRTASLPQIEDMRALMLGSEEIRAVSVPHQAMVVVSPEKAKM